VAQTRTDGACSAIPTRVPAGCDAGLRCWSRCRERTLVRRGVAVDRGCGHERPLDTATDEHLRLPRHAAGLTCFGTVSASGVAGGSEVNSFIAGISQPINSFLTDPNGDLDSTRLAMVCRNVSAVSVSSQAPNGTTVAASGNAPC
jgi:hypothetical protein